MKYCDYETILTSSRLNRYKIACGGNEERALALYMQNIKLSNNLFGIISLFEVALRNAIDMHYSTALHNPDWLRDAITAGGQFDYKGCAGTRDIVQYALTNRIHGIYTKEKLIAECEMGVWCYMFARNQYNALGATLIDIFSAKPDFVGIQKFDYKYVADELAKINTMRNRIAHHEPICFHTKTNVISTKQVRYIYGHILSFLTWLGIDAKEYVQRIDNVILECDNLNSI